MRVTIAPVYLHLNAYAVSIHSHRGNLQLCSLYLTLQGEVFHTFSNIEFVPLINPGNCPFIPEGCTGLAAVRIRKKQEEKFKEILIYD